MNSSPGGRVSQRPLHHAHLGVQLVHLRHEDGLRRRRKRRRPPFELPLVAEDDVLEALGPVGIELCLDRRPAHELVAEHDVALEDPPAAAPGRERPLVLDRLARVVQEDRRPWRGRGRPRDRGEGAPGRPGPCGPCARGARGGRRGASGWQPAPSGRPRRSRPVTWRTVALSSARVIESTNPPNSPPEGVRVLGCRLHEVRDHLGRRQLLRRHDRGARELRREPSLVGLGPALDPDDRALLGGAQRLERRAVREDSAAERPRPVAQLRAQVRVAVRGRLGGELPAGRGRSRTARPAEASAAFRSRTVERGVGDSGIFLDEFGVGPEEGVVRPRPGWSRRRSPPAGCARRRGEARPGTAGRPASRRAPTQSARTVTARPALQRVDRRLVDADGGLHAAEEEVLDAPAGAERVRDGGRRRPAPRTRPSRAPWAPRRGRGGQGRSRRACRAPAR